MLWVRLMHRALTEGAGTLTTPRAVKQGSPCSREPSRPSMPFYAAAAKTDARNQKVKVHLNAN